MKEYYLYEKIVVEYEYNNEKHNYVTDFYLPYRNLIIEVKNKYFQKRDADIIKEKKKAVLNNGYYYSIMDINDIRNLSFD